MHPIEGGQNIVVAGQTVGGLAIAGAFGTLDTEIGLAALTQVIGPPRGAAGGGGHDGSAGRRRDTAVPGLRRAIAALGHDGVAEDLAVTGYFTAVALAMKMYGVTPPDDTRA